MKQVLQNRLPALAMLCLVQPSFLFAQNGSPGLRPPAVPSNLEVPDGHAVYLKTHAVGTQNYVCLPGANGPAWSFLGPQATLFVALPWSPNEPNLQVATHFLSSNPKEAGTARPAWQGSHDSSTIWGKAIGNSSDPAYVEAGAIPWLLVEVAGAKHGFTGQAGFAQTTYIQRVSTSGGIAPATGCEETSYGRVALVPYTTDYYFYRANGRK